MGSGLPAVERLVGALSTLAVGLTIYVVHRVLRPKAMTMDDYYRQKYMDTSDMIGHKGSCGCGAMTFIVLAPRNICAFDDSNTFPSKKGRIPVLIVPMTHLQMTSQSTEDANSFVSIYTHHETPTFASQHVFCKRCGIHLFHMELSRTDRVAINVHCIDDDYIQELRVVFVPKGGRPIFERLSVDAIEGHATSSSSTTKAIGQGRKQSGAQKQIPPPSTFERQLMAWSQLQTQADQPPVVPITHVPAKQPEPAKPETPRHDPMTTPPTPPHDSISHIPQQDLVRMKHQLQYYLQRHFRDGDDGATAVV
ncbi:hypothetical protein SDRG_11974 [Saprolegnia diclina VS20]|uniref:CENP-V/GFA domain-containing protein n=1 Tax=Saprolegnia diclina (strain VS20) TaxID=1156394 RepID=T0PXY6_SAPDV|nr:hypothetical protein SDRG_11974 [Saprolegnia diclina VS20]EQC30399.1 hypothetical protein SDRG_11974 [Saprolegnia diclina VS20]|eukprot:XP_008616252.1 hypothetical protein SDRG_11974 [Saprolegnia diclina VS20]